MILADTGEAMDMDKKERKDFDIETMKDALVSIKTLESILTG